MKLTTVILAHNEEASIAKAIQSAMFSDEIIVVNDNSTDDTVTIAKKLGARVIQLPVGAHFGDARNRVESASHGDWILHIDADEIVTPELAHSICAVINDNSSFLAFRIRRTDFFWGQQLRHGETRTAHAKGIIRLHKKNVGKWHGRVHETIKIGMTVGTLDGHLHHYPHQTVKEFIGAVNLYSSLRAGELRDQNKTLTFIQLIFYPPFKFIYSYIAKGGFLDGAAGFAYAFFMSFHSFLVRAKIYTNQQ